ncbi:MAG: GNAT family N-acetyltransferase [Verrucomicrobia bacterium]|nr:GNAT family N-acetyltransferase [Verrucomicrobiota bacterium]
MSHIEHVDDPTAQYKLPSASDPEWLAEWPLAGGPLVRFRHVRPDDQPLITEAIRTASRETLLHRFFSPIRSVAPDQLRRMLAIDRTDELCVVGVVSANDATRIVCGARYVRLPKPGAAEVAFTVHDDFQRRGLGTFLLQLLARLAVADGIRWFEADVMTSNQKMLNLFMKLAPEHSRTRQIGDVDHLVFEVSTVAQTEFGPHSSAS